MCTHFDRSSIQVVQWRDGKPGADVRSALGSVRHDLADVERSQQPAKQQLISRERRRMGFMRVAVVTDIHGNRRAFEAVLADLKRIAPDLIVHGGDLVSCWPSCAFSKVYRDCAYRAPSSA